MEDQNQQNSNPQQSQPLTQASDTSYISSSQPKKVIQPSTELVQEVKAEQAVASASSPNPSPNMQSTPAPTQTAQNQPSLSSVPSQVAIPAQQTRPDTSSIYPDATKGINSNSGRYSSLLQNDTKAEPETFTFHEGYTLGSTVFWYQLIAGIVLGTVTGLLLRGYDTPLILTISTVIDYFILTYLSYRVMKSYAVGEPLWIAPIGMATQTVIAGVADAFVLTIEKAIGASLGAGGLFISTIVGLAFLAAIYFLTRLSWGLAFSIYGIVKNKVVVKVLAISIVAVFIGYLGYHFVSQQKTTSTANKIAAVGTTNQEPDSTPTSYAKKTFNGHDFKVTLLFDPKAFAQITYDPTRGSNDPGLNETNISGIPLDSTKPLIVSIRETSSDVLAQTIKSHQLESRLDGGNASAFDSSGVATAFNVKIMGQQYTAYYFDTNADQIFVDVPLNNGMWYSVELESHEPNVGQGYPITQELAIPILDSISIQS